MQESPADLEGENGWQQRIACAPDADIPAWMEPVRPVIDGFPHLDEERYFARLRVYIRNGRALILKDGDTAVGIMAFDGITGDRLSGGASAIPEKGVAREPVQWPPFCVTGFCCPPFHWIFYGNGACNQLQLWKARQHPVKIGTETGIITDSRFLTVLQALRAVYGSYVLYFLLHFCADV